MYDCCIVSYSCSFTVAENKVNSNLKFCHVFLAWPRAGTDPHCPVFWYQKYWYVSSNLQRMKGSGRSGHCTG
jgi:hypothetical protein